MIMHVIYWCYIYFVDGLQDAACDFGQPNICGYTVNCTGCKQELTPFGWGRKSGAGPSLYTGPRGDVWRESDPGGML